MNPAVRFAIVAAALGGVCFIGRAVWPVVAGNLEAIKSWTRAQGVVVAMNQGAEFELGQEPATRRVLVTLDHSLGLALFRKVPLLVDPSDPSRVKPAGLLQMWLFPAAISFLILVLLGVAVLGVTFGKGQVVAQAEDSQGKWMFTPSPGPLADGAMVHSPSRQWKIVLGWSLLGVALAVLSLMGSGGNRIGRLYAWSLGTAFALLLWGYAWHTASLEISANNQGIRMTSVLGWRDVPWGLVRSAEKQAIFTTYYNGNMRMWELPFPGSTVNVYALLDQRGRTLMSFSPELEPSTEVTHLFRLCTEQTGQHVQSRDVPIKY